MTSGVKEPVEFLKLQPEEEVVRPPERVYTSKLATGL